MSTFLATGTAFVLLSPFTITRIAAIAIATTAMVNSLKALLPEDGLDAPIRFFLLPGTHVSRDIVGYARQNKASAIVLGVRQRSRLASHLPMEGVAWILAKATCPVYTLSHSSTEVRLTEPSSERHPSFDHVVDQISSVSNLAPKIPVGLSREMTSQAPELQFPKRGSVIEHVALIAREKAHELSQERSVAAAALANGENN